MIRSLQELFQYRALLWALTVRELKARYRASVLGFLWTFLNPTLNMAVYVLVFGYFMKSQVPQYPYYLFCGLLPWIFFSTSVLGGTTSVSDRRDLLTKVRFPAQVLPATVVLTNLFNFLLSLPLLFVLGALYEIFKPTDLDAAGLAQWHSLWPSVHLVMLVPVLLVQTTFTLAVTYFLAAMNVAFRDLQHIVGNVVQMAFFLTPVLWPVKNLAPDQQTLMLYGNPLASLMAAWRDIFYEHQWPAPGPLAVVTGLSLVFLWLASGVFERRREEFAELI